MDANKSLVWAGPNGTEIAAKMIDGREYVDATAMARDGGKVVYEYFRNARNDAFIKELSRDVEIHVSKLVVTEHGKHVGGGRTWVVEEIAHHFGQWISPKYAVFVSRLLTALRRGEAKVAPTKALSEHEQLCRALGQYVATNDLRFKDLEARIAVLESRPKAMPRNVVKRAPMVHPEGKVRVGEFLHAEGDWSLQNALLLGSTAAAMFPNDYVQKGNWRYYPLTHLVQAYEITKSQATAHGTAGAALSAALRAARRA